MEGSHRCELVGQCVRGRPRITASGRISRPPHAPDAQRLNIRVHLRMRIRFDWDSVGGKLYGRCWGSEVVGCRARSKLQSGRYRYCVVRHLNFESISACGIFLGTVQALKISDVSRSYRNVLVYQECIKNFRVTE